MFGKGKGLEITVEIEPIKIYIRIKDEHTEEVSNSDWSRKEPQLFLNTSMIFFIVQLLFCNEHSSRIHKRQTSALPEKTYTNKLLTTRN